MKEIIINTGKAYPVIVGNAFEEIEQKLKDQECVVITDSNLFQIYGCKFDKYNIITIPSGEESKNWDTIVRVYKELLNFNSSRNTLLLGFGGGVVCDVTGFVADTFMRGCKFGLVATSLLAQVDAAIGGKNGFNLNGIKNLIGTFKQPEFVVCDPLLLKTLPLDEVKSGLGEIVKYSLIADPQLFKYLYTNAERIIDVQTEVFEYLIETCVHIKAGFIEQDENDTGLRNHLNFGHTFGHAIERIEQISHGVAIVKGMLIATKVSALLNISSSSLYPQLIELLDKLELPTEFCFHNELIPLIHNDKKKQSSSEIRLILIKDIGTTELYDIEFDDLENMIDSL